MRGKSTLGTSARVGELTNVVPLVTGLRPLLSRNVTVGLHSETNLTLFVSNIALEVTKGWKIVAEDFVDLLPVDRDGDG
jgi:hypothetical protein